MHTVTLARGIHTRAIHTVDECLSVRSWVNLHVGKDLPVPTICMYQGQPLLRAQWDVTLIYADVVFVPLPLGGGGGGGGKDVMRMIGMAVVAILATIASIYLPTLMPAAWGMTDRT